MDSTYTPRTDAGWREWALPTSDLLVAQAATYGINPTDATALQTAAIAYADALDTATAPLTAGRVATYAKNDKLKTLRAVAKPIMSSVELNVALSNEQRGSVGLRPRATGRSSATVPVLPPTVSTMLLSSTSLRTTVREADAPDRRRRPKGVKSILVFTHINDGSIPPGDSAAWQFYGSEGRTSFELAWPEMDSPKTVWVRCAYISSRNETGPASAAAKLVLPGTGLSSASGTNATPLKIAA